MNKSRGGRNSILTISLSALSLKCIESCLQKTKAVKTTLLLLDLLRKCLKKSTTCKGMTLWKRQRCRGVPTWQLKKLTSIDVHLDIFHINKEKESETKMQIKLNLHNNTIYRKERKSR